MNIKYIFIQSKLFFLTSILVSTIGCVPTIENTYKAPQTNGVLLQLSTQNEQEFSPVSDAKIYYREYPKTVVNSDKQGQFVLPAVIESEAKILMVGHAYINHEIIIEQQGFNYITFAKGTLNSRRFEEIKLDPIILPTPQNLQTDGLAWKNKSAWPCDIALIQSLDLAVGLTEELLRKFPHAAMEKDSVQLNIKNQFYESTQLLYQTKHSCKWQENNGATQQEHILQTRQYFSGIQQRLNEINNYLLID